MLSLVQLLVLLDNGLCYSSNVMNTHTILIVEDEEAVLKVLASKLERAGFTVLEARNGIEGLATAKDKHPDLILLDVIMPKMDGVTMLKELRSDEWGKDALVIVLTNLGEDWETSRFIKSGVKDYLVKADWALDDVVEKVRGILSPSE